MNFSSVYKYNSKVYKFVNYLNGIIRFKNILFGNSHYNNNDKFMIGYSFNKIK